MANPRIEGFLGGWYRAACADCQWFSTDQDSEEAADDLARGHDCRNVTVKVPRVRCCENPETGFEHYPEWDGEAWECTVHCLTCGNDTVLARIIEDGERHG